jgi:hypothetical protein
VKRVLARCAVVVAVGLGAWLVWEGYELVAFGQALAGRPEDREWVESRCESPGGEWIAELVGFNRGPGHGGEGAGGAKTEAAALVDLSEPKNDLQTVRDRGRRPGGSLDDQNVDREARYRRIR